MRRALLPLSVLIAVVVPFVPARAQVGSVASPVVFAPKPGTTLGVDGMGPFRGSLEVRRSGGSLTLVNQLDLDQYVMGVREVPGTWPMEALKAQAVAARTYVLWEIEKGYWKQFGFDVCGTTSCQVYQGATAELGERGRRWSQAVRETSGQVLLHEGHPALTRYHSSSGGRTLANEVVYPTDGPRPYLRAIDDPFDEVSPLHRWTQTFKREHLQRILHDAIGLNGQIADVTVTDRDMKIKTLGGELDMTRVRFRRVMSNAAPSVFPDLYPGIRSDGEPMPFTMPSSRFTVEKTADGFVFHGIGYGHGVGMSQYGALGRAQKGHKYDEILAAYYGGLRPQPWTGQRSIRVAIARDIGGTRINGNGPFQISGGGQLLKPSTLGSWAAAATGTSSLVLSPPQGHALPLSLGGVTAPDELLVDPPKQGAALVVSFAIPKPAIVTAVLSKEGKEIARAKTVVEAGERKVSVPLDPNELERRATYQVKLDAFDGTKTVSASRDVVLVLPTRAFWRIVATTLFALVFGIFWRRRQVVRRARERHSAL
jgi:SpoIID/LytB domain protein